MMNSESFLAMKMNDYESSIEVDDNELMKQGYRPELLRNFSFLSVLGVSFGLTNSWLGISSSLATGIGSGGPLLIIYGLLIVGFFNFNIGISLSELISAYPNSGGQYYWTIQLAPDKFKNFLGYVTGNLCWLGSVFTCASITLSTSISIVAVYGLNNPNYEFKKWHVFVTHEAFNATVTIFNIWEKPLSTISTIALIISLLTFLVTFLICLICSRGNYQSASFVFNEFRNSTGWDLSSISFIVGLINPSWAFVGLDSASHMAEELRNPAVIIPRCIMGTIVLGFVTALSYSIAMFFCIKDTDGVVNSLYPIMEIFYQLTNSTVGASCMTALMITCGFLCNIAANTWLARNCWSFSRDNGIPGSRFLSQIHPKLKVPLNAHLLSNSWVAVIGCIYMASSTAFNAIISACIVLLFLSYSIPIICLILKGRNNIIHGKFWYGKFGYLCNYISLIWVLFCLIFFSFPFSMPAESNSMNYISAVYGGVFCYILGYWIFRGKYTFNLTNRVKEK
jgi:choline transport protein